MSTESKKPSKVVYDRTGTRYWCIPTPNQNKSDTDKIPNCCAAHQKEYLAQQTEKSHSYLSNTAQALESSQRKSSEQDFDSPINLPNFQHPRRERSSSLPLPNELLMSNFLAYPGQPEEDETDDNEEDYSYNDSDYDGFEFSHPLQGYLSESQEVPYTTSNDQKKVVDNVATELNLDSLWRSKSIIEERDLSLKHFYSLPLPERKNVVKVQKDSETFLKNLSSKNRSRQNRSSYGKNELCNCSNCDPKRVLSEVDFQAFLTRCKMARTMVAAATIEQSSDKISRDVQEVYEPEFSSTLKKKIYETALKFLEDGQTYLEISNRFLTEELKALAACPNKDPSDSYGDPADFPPEMFPNDPYADDGENSSTSDVSPTTSNFQAIAAQMISLNPHHSSKLPGISFRNGPPPRAFAISTTEYDSDHNCQEKCCIQHISHFRGTESDEADSPNSDERFRSIMEKATDYDSLVKIYVTKIFDHRILNHFQERQIQIKQEKLIEEFQQEEKKTKQKPKKPKKKTKNTKQYEEMLARKKDEARLEEEARKVREAEEQEMEKRRLREEEELAARVEKARAINRQAKEEAEKNKKAAPKTSVMSQNNYSTKISTSFQSSKLSKSGAYNSSSFDSQPSPSPVISKDASLTTPKTNLIKTIPSPKTAPVQVPSASRPPPENKSITPNLAISQTKASFETPFSTASKLPVIREPLKLLPEGNNDSDWPSLKEIPVKSPTRPKKEVSESKTPLHSPIKNSETSKATSVPIKNATISNVDDPQNTNPPNSEFITNLSWASNLPSSTCSQSHGLFSPTFPQLPTFNAAPYGVSQFNGFNPPPGNIFPNNIPLAMNPLVTSTSDRLQTNGIPALQRPVWNEPTYRTTPTFNNMDIGRGWPPSNNLPQVTIGNNVIPSNFNDTNEPIMPSLRTNSFSNTPPINSLAHPSVDPLSGISINYIMEIQDNIRHSYFTLLLGMGLDLTIQTQKRPFVPLVDLYIKYKSLFISKIDSLIQFHQICSYQLPQPGSSLLVNAFQFQSSPNHPNILIRYALGIMFNNEIYQPPATSLLSFNNNKWNSPKVDIPVGGMIGGETSSFSSLPSSHFSNDQTASSLSFRGHEPFSIPPMTSNPSLTPPIFSSGNGSSFLGDSVL